MAKANRIRHPAQIAQPFSSFALPESVLFDFAYVEFWQMFHPLKPYQTFKILKLNNQKQSMQVYAIYFNTIYFALV